MPENSESRCQWQSPHKPLCVDVGAEACSMVSSLNNQAIRGGHDQPEDRGCSGRYWKEKYWTEYGQRIIHTVDELRCPFVNVIIGEVQRLTSLKTKRKELY